MFVILSIPPSECFVKKNFNSTPIFYLGESFGFVFSVTYTRKYELSTYPLSEGDNFKPDPYL